MAFGENIETRYRSTNGYS